MASTRTLSSFARAGALFWLLLETEDVFDAQILSEKLDMPKSTLFRHLETLLECGLLVRVQRGRYRPSPSLLIATRACSANRVMAEIARPHLDKLANAIGGTAHLGVLEADMVTYIVKADRSVVELFTRENEQLEAYCSAIGKVLLAELPNDQINAYLGSEPFPKLTDKTIVDPEFLRAELLQTKAQGYGVDDAEIHRLVYCLAAPVHGFCGEVLGAISLSANTPEVLTTFKSEYLQRLKETALLISNGLRGGR